MSLVPLFLLPALVALVLFRIVPAGFAAVTSLDAPEGWGLGNYAYLFGSESFRNSLLVTLAFSVILNPVQVVLALLLAVGLRRRFPGNAFARALIFLPTAVPLAVASVVWGAAFRPDSIVNALLVSIGGRPQPFLTSEHQALATIMLLLCWVGVGYWMMFLLAGLDDIPDTYYEAAALDGAGPIRTFWNVTLPLLRRSLAFVLVAATVANFVMFAPIQILTGGGPQESTNLLMHDIYRQAYTFADLPLASAQTFVLLVVMVVVTAVQFRLLKFED